MKESFKEKKGITLIALVITIIVLLILAGVSIAMLTGQNGILTQAQNSKTVTENKSAEEKVKLAVMGARADDGTLTVGKLRTELANYGGTVEGDTFPVTVTVDGKSFTVTNTGVVTATGSSTTNPNPPASTDTLKASDIAAKTDKTKIYGATVTGYTLPSGTTTDVKWKIFYADNSNIYLIADNYVERANLPNSTDGTTATANKPNDGYSSNARTAYFSNILGDYAGSSRITESKLKALNNDYFNTKGYTSANNNMKSVAYMMDTTAWNSKFRDTSKAEYVVGGPTVELLFKSYNEKYKTAYESQAVESSDKSNTGYQIRKTSSDSWSNYVNSMLTKSDSLYVITKETDALAYWLASPSAYNPDRVMYVDSGGYVERDPYNIRTDGFRPLVCLKSDVTLEKVSDTEYAIQ